MKPSPRELQALGSRKKPKERLSPYAQYEFLKRVWIQKHPRATPKEYEKAMMQIAKECGV